MPGNVLRCHHGISVSWSQLKPKMIVNVRTYTLVARMLPRYLKLFEDIALPADEPYLPHPFLLIRHDVLTGLGGYSHAHLAEDADLSWRLAEDHRIAVLATVAVLALALLWGGLRFQMPSRMAAAERLDASDLSHPLSTLSDDLAAGRTNEASHTVRSSRSGSGSAPSGSFNSRTGSSRP